MKLHFFTYCRLCRQRKSHLIDKRGPVSEWRKQCLTCGKITEVSVDDMNKMAKAR